MFTAIRDIKRGEEILVSYGYGIDVDNVPEWYYNSFVEEVGLLPTPHQKWPEDLIPGGDWES